MLKSVASFLLLIVPVYSSADTAPTHCNGDEKIYFNCFIKDSKKVASVCGAGYNENNHESGYLQYRFGLIGNQEFKYPSTTNKDDMKDKFNFSSSRTADYSHYDLALQFSNLNYAYIVYSGEDRKPDDQRSYSSSITVWKLEEPCLSKCPPRAPYASPEGKIVKVFTCSNSNAGEKLYLDSVIPLMTSPGRSRHVTLPYPLNQ